MHEDSIVGLVAIVLIFGTPLLITVGIITSLYLHNHLRQRDKENARRAYRDLLRDKVDVIKTAMLIDYKFDEVLELDKRLEKLVGEDKLRLLLNGDASQLKAAALHEAPADFELEISNRRRRREVRNA